MSSEAWNMVKEELHRSRAEVMARGHTWDVADVVDAIEVALERAESER